MEVTQAQRKSFNSDGFIILDRIIDDETVERAREAVERCFRGDYGYDRRPEPFRKELSRLEEGEAKIGQIVHGRLLDDDLWKIMNSPDIGRLIASLTGAQIVSLTEDQLFKKPPHSPFVAMHQDYPYQTFASNADLTTCWIALTDVTPESSPLEYIRGSHTWATAPMPEHFADGGDAEYMEAVDPVRPDGWEDELVQVIVPAGGGAVHYTKTMHGSRANTSDHPRVAIAMHHALESCRVRRDGIMWHESMWEGTYEGSLVTNELMPVVYPVPDVLLAVNGTLMRGLALNASFVELGATFVREDRTEPSYRLWSIDDTYPAMQRDERGAAIAVEIWDLPDDRLAVLLDQEPPGLAVGLITLADGDRVPGVLGEAWICEGRRDITEFGGWRAYTSSIAIGS